MKTFLLIAENEDGWYCPLGEFTGAEAIEVAKADFAGRSAENDDVCVSGYALWERGADGRYHRGNVLFLDAPDRNILPQYSPDEDGDYPSWLVSNNID